ncbi:hypothetical protein ACM26V_13345 [Salipaludibacillus sp. HK11]|uniref:hypothetical protein n=1 Tax=Salipaludibacillus sp. HK11 TaxID=3394320 RepID=UPI0039FDBCF4
MNELDLIKVIMHKLSVIEKTMIKQEDLEEINEHLFEQESNLKTIQDNLKEIKVMMEIKHIENMNSDDILLRSILENKEIQYK